MAQFIKTQFIADVSMLRNMKPGQWVQFDSGNRGQYMGTTLAGVDVVRYQKQGNFARVDAKANKPLREYAKLYGAQ